MRIKYHVRLTDDERAMLEALIKQERPKVAQHKKRRAGILLAIDENQSPPDSRAGSQGVSCQAGYYLPPSPTAC